MTQIRIEMIDHTTEQDIGIRHCDIQKRIQLALAVGDFAGVVVDREGGIRVGIPLPTLVVGRVAPERQIGALEGIAGQDHRAVGERGRWIWHLCTTAGGARGLG